VNRIHPTALVDPEVRLGDGNVVGPYAVLCGPCVIGDGNWIGPHAVIGTPAQYRGGTHPGFDELGEPVSGPAWTDEGPGAGVVIGDGNVLRELTTVQQGRLTATTIGSRCYVMAGAHVNHDAVVGDDVVLSNNVVLAGTAWVGDRANLGMAAVVHQLTSVGAGAMIGMQAAVRHPVPPYALASGVPARLRRANARALEAMGVSADAVRELTEHIAGAGPRPVLPPSVLADFDAFADATGSRGRT
jgi:UDP-N-acetylglucosamine acyltransferase